MVTETQVAPRPCENEYSESPFQIRQFFYYEELQRLLQALENIQWFEDQGYLPQLRIPHPYHLDTILTIDQLRDHSLIAKYKELLSDYDYQRDFILFLSSKVSQFRYYHTKQTLVNEHEKLAIGIQILSQEGDNTGITLPDGTITICISHWEMWGSYRPDTNTVIVRSSGQTMFEMPAELAAMHEITHLSIQKSIVHKFRLDQIKKEAMVDAIITHHPKLHQLFPHYSSYAGLIRSRKDRETTSHLQQAVANNDGNPLAALITLGYDSS